ncbi:hypothetical protein F5X96DRAFT_666754 [Biscogniauxia mediterranea]|nr:hypothetical protein F5X96DRAFT_666754 [Biscogniauxia mediterranea]
MAKPVADVDNRGEAAAGFVSDDSRILGFSHLHDSGTGGSQSPSLGNFPPAVPASPGVQMITTYTQYKYSELRRGSIDGSVGFNFPHKAEVYSDGFTVLAQQPCWIWIWSTSETPGIRARTFLRTNETKALLGNLLGSAGAWDPLRPPAPARRETRYIMARVRGRLLHVVGGPGVREMPDLDFGFGKDVEAAWREKLSVGGAARPEGDEQGPII